MRASTASRWSEICWLLLLPLIRLFFPFPRSLSFFYFFRFAFIALIISSLAFVSLTSPFTVPLSTPVLFYCNLFFILIVG